ncbi:Glycerol 2-dehydrogenase (NADP(+)) [Podosphaera aphanis]|nr:Glycerol 2-dehydrogenase (NADP(+)) [Podosphaera aphanis]
MGIEDAAISPPILTLNNGVKMPALGFGTFAKEKNDGETHTAVLHALNMGYRHLDCAQFYENEDEVGSALTKFLTQNDSVQREDSFITTKVWNHLHEPEDVEWSLKRSLLMLQTTYVDAFLIHWPIAVERNPDHSVKIGTDGKYVLNHKLTSDPSPTWRAMENLYKAGLTKSIGLSNFTEAGIEQILSFAHIKPSINQVEIHPFLPQDALIAFCLSRSILPVAYSPLGSQNQVPSTKERISSNKDLINIAENKKCSLAQLLIAWGLKRGYAVLPKSSNEERIKSNIQLVTLSKEEFEAVNKVANGRCSRFVNMKDTFGYDVWPEDS